MSEVPVTQTSGRRWPRRLAVAAWLSTIVLVVVVLIWSADAVSRVLLQTALGVGTLAALLTFMASMARSNALGRDFSSTERLDPPDRFRTHPERTLKSTGFAFKAAMALFALTMILVVVGLGLRAIA